MRTVEYVRVCEELIMDKVKPIPDGYPRVIPYLSVDDAGAALQFYGTAFGAKERMRMPGPDGRIGHAEIELGDSVVMLADAFPEMGGQTPKDLGGTAVTIMLYVDDVDAVVDRAVDAGATIERPVENQFYGDRAGQIVDPFGHKWFLATHVEDVDADELERRAAAAMGG
jgi:PhnB protein